MSRYVDADNILEQYKPRVSDDVWKESEFYKIINDAPTANVIEISAIKKTLVKYFDQCARRDAELCKEVDMASAAYWKVLERHADMYIAAMLKEQEKDGAECEK